MGMAIERDERTATGRRKVRDGTRSSQKTRGGWGRDLVVGHHLVAGRWYLVAGRWHLGTGRYHLVKRREFGSMADLTAVAAWLESTLPRASAWRRRKQVARSQC